MSTSWCRYRGEVRGSTKLSSSEEHECLSKIMFHCPNPSNRGRDISQDKRKLQPAGGARGNVRGSPKSVGFIIWGPWMSVQNFMGIRPIVVETGPKWWTDRPPLPYLILTHAANMVKKYIQCNLIGNSINFRGNALPWLMEHATESRYKCMQEVSPRNCCLLKS